ncbi:MAG TPA: hypothetical protein VJP78_01850 [Thermoleophilia bacterium]|nr:hypothetical protein [Thermoleophilia bacterium]
MRPQHLEMIGLILNIIGAFFVSVEAIKLPNLRKLRERVVLPVHRRTLSPRIVVTADRIVTSGSNASCLLYVGLHYVAGLLVIILLNLMFSGMPVHWLMTAAGWTLERRWYVVVVVILFALWCVVAGLWLLGELVHLAITGLTRAPLVLLDFIDERTPQGTIGIIGFALLFAGFCCQFWGTYLAGRQ